MRARDLPLLGSALLPLLLLLLVASRATADTRPEPAGSAVWPLAPVPAVVEGFDPPETRWGAGHRGVDLAGSPGQRVRSARPGTVTFAGRLAGRGVVVVDHGPTRTTYEPVEATVRVGDPVAAGDPIGRLQTGGSHCAPATCLHWGLLAGEEYLDPLTLVGAGPVRLLPLEGVAPGSAQLWVGATPPGARFAGWSDQAAPEAPRPPGDAALFRRR